MSLSYVRLRQLHFRNNVAERFRGMGRTAFVVLAFFGGSGVAVIAGIIVVLANGLMALTHSHAQPFERFGIILGWQLATLGLLWPLRSAIFMQQAESFLSALPIPVRDIRRADMLIAMQCYSLLWLPLAWLLYALCSRMQPMPALLACTSYLVMVGTGMALDVLLLRGAYRRAATMALPLLVLVVARPQSVSGVIALLGMSALASTVVVRMRSPRVPRGRSAGRGHAGYERLAVASAFVLPVALHTLRESLAVRAGCLLGAWALSVTLLASHTPDAGLATALLIGLTALSSAALYGLPVLIRSTVLERLEFLAGHCRFRWHVTILAATLPTVLFALCLGASWMTANHALPAGTAEAVLPVYPLYFCSGLFVLGALGASWQCPRDAMRWLIPTAHIVLTLVLLMVALT